MNKLFAKILGISVGIALATGVGAAALLNNNEFKKAEAATQVTYDLTKNFSTYASAWSGYGSHTITASDVSATTGASIAFTNVSKQTNTINDRPVVAAKDGVTSTMTFTLDSSVAANYNITTVSVSFKQWSSSKKVAAALYKGTTVSGTALSSFAQTATPSNLTTSNLNGSTFIVNFTTTYTSNQQLGVSSIVIGLEAKATYGTTNHISVTSMPDKLIYHVGQTLDLTGLEVTAFDGANEDTANYKDVTSQITTSLANGTYVFQDSDVPTTGMTISLTEGGSKFYADPIEFSVYALAEYELVTTAPSDWSGNYLLVSQNEDEDYIAFNGSLEAIDALGNYQVVTKSGNKITAGQEMEVTIAKISGSDYSIKIANGKYIGSLTAMPSDSNKNNGLRVSDDPIVNTISLTDSVVSIAGTNGNILSYNSNVSADRFRYYYGGAGVSLYKLVESDDAELYAEYFLSTLSTGTGHVCQADGSTDLAELKANWKSLADDYADLTAAEKESFRLGVASETGNNIQQALALYDYIAAKYNTQLESSELTNYNFMNRSITPASSNSVNVIKDNTTLITVIIITSIISVSSIGMFFIIRKRKEQR